MSRSRPIPVAAIPVTVRGPGRLAALAVALCLGACASAPEPPPRSTATPPPSTSTDSPMPALDVAEIEQRALLLLLVDRQIFEPVALSGAIDGSPGLRAETAIAIGRIGDPRGVGLLERLLGDPEASVRRAAALALGELGQNGVEAVVPSLLGAVVDPDRRAGTLAVEGLAKTGVTLDRVVTRLIDAPPDELQPRLLPSLFRFEGPGVVGWATQALDDPGSGDVLREQAVYALAREPRPEGAPALRRLVDDPSPRIRALAARGLGRVGGRDDADLLRPLLDDPETEPVIQALDAGERLVARGLVAPPEDWRLALVRRLDDPRPHVRAAALDVAGSWLLDEALGDRLVELASPSTDAADDPWARRLALRALAEGGDPRAEELLRIAAADPRADVRRTAARAAGLAGLRDLLDQLRGDDDAGVRRAALATLLEADVADAAGLAALALDDPDPSVRVTALEHFALQPTLDVDFLESAYRRALPDVEPDARLSAVDALRARADSTPTERGAALAALEAAAEDPAWLVRRRAIDALRVLEPDGERLPLGSAVAEKPVATYRDIVRRTRAPRRLDVRTERGSFVVELDCPRAPLTCLSIVQLAASGVYDGLTFHRVVPGFVVQGGDPRGDGSGGPGYSLRDEIGTLRYGAAGVVGIAHAGPDTGGSQFFVTLAPQPHLDGGYTVAGRVVEGLEVVETLREGDRIERVTERANR